MSLTVRNCLTLLPALWIGFFWLLGDSALYDLDEGAFTEATREMFENGNFIATYLNGEPRYDKPILIYWLQAALMLRRAVWWVWPRSRRALGFRWS